MRVGRGVLGKHGLDGLVGGRRGIGLGSRPALADAVGEAASKGQAWVAVGRRHGGQWMATLAVVEGLRPSPATASGERWKGEARTVVDGRGWGRGVFVVDEPWFRLVILLHIAQVATRGGWGGCSVLKYVAELASRHAQATQRFKSSTSPPAHCKLGLAHLPSPSFPK